MLHDRDHAFDDLEYTAKAMGIEDVVTAPHAPWQNALVERFIGSARRECLDHVIVFNEAGLLRLMTRYGSYYERSRTHVCWTKTRRFIGRSGQPAKAPSSPSRRSVASITDTNGAPPDRPARRAPRARAALADCL